MSEQVFNLPDVGEGLTEAELVSWLVAPGDEVQLNQLICEIETAKSLVELPSPFEGRVVELLAEPGDTVPVGEPIMKVAQGVTGDESSIGPASAAGAVADDSAGEPSKSDSETDNTPATIAAATPDTSQDQTPSAAGSEPENQGEANAATKKNAVLVGYGAGGSAKSRRRKGVSNSVSRTVTVAEPGLILAKPPIRKLAKDLDVDLSTVTGTGIGGEVLRDDVVRHASQASVFRNIVTPETPGDREERIPVKGVRKQIALAMSRSAFTAPHVSVFTEIDATRTMEYVKRLKASTDFAGVKVSPLLVFAKAIIWAVRRNRMVNATFTDKEIIVHNFVNLGIAAATPRGLLVPNIKDAQDLSMLELAKAIEQLTITAREGKTTPAQMSQGTITVTNIGVFGMDTGTPILNPGEAAIVAMGTIKQKPWVVNGEILPRMVTTVGGSFDHRVVDGDVISRFVADVASVIEEPALLLD